MFLFLMLQNKVHFDGEYFMACFPLCARQMEGNGNWWVVKIKEHCWPFGKSFVILLHLQVVFQLQLIVANHYIWLYYRAGCLVVDCSPFLPFLHFLFMLQPTPLVFCLLHDAEQHLPMPTFFPYAENFSLSSFYLISQHELTQIALTFVKHYPSSVSAASRLPDFPLPPPLSLLRLLPLLFIYLFSRYCSFSGPRLRVFSTSTLNHPTSLKPSICWELSSLYLQPLCLLWCPGLGI